MCTQRSETGVDSFATASEMGVGEITQSTDGEVKGVAQCGALIHQPGAEFTGLSRRYSVALSGNNNHQHLT